MIFTLNAGLLLLSAGSLTPQFGVRVPSPGVIPEAEALISELGCLHCHEASDSLRLRMPPKPAPRLEEVGARISPSYLRRFLSDPASTRPGTSMPDLLGGLEAEEREAALEELVHFLSARGGPLDTAPTSASVGMLEEGRQLLHEVGCVACHQPAESLDQLADWFQFEAGEQDPPAPANDDAYVPEGTLPPPEIPFGNLAEKTQLTALRAFLLDPVAVRPSGRMPSLELSRKEAHDIAVYLLRGQSSADSGFERNAGFRYRYFEQGFDSRDMNTADATAVREGVLEGALSLPEHREDQFGFEFHGTLSIETPGLYGFRSVSDDGSWVYVDGERVIDNGGTHPMVSRTGEIELEAGEHEIRITFFEAGGGEGLEVHWSGPDFEERPLEGKDVFHSVLNLTPPVEPDFRLDPRLVALGEKRFESLGCAECHSPTEARRTALGDCDPGSSSACTSPAPEAGRPRFGWSPQQREAVASHLGGAHQLAPLQADEKVTRLMARQRCFACHRRDGIGGPHPQRKPYFFARGDEDLGEEGRIPPHLDFVGAKLEPSWMRRVLEEGADCRPYLLTRMPQFGAEALGDLGLDFLRADRKLEAPPISEFTTESMLNGRKLVGTQGFGCIQCHQFNGYDSLGIPAVDLGEVHDRLRYPWFHALLKDPESIGMNTRMPNFLIDGHSPVKDVLQGDIDRQIDAIWNYLSLGNSMPLPAGLNAPDSTFELELVEGEAPRLVGVFMRDVSPRVVAVGTPEHVHYAFDLENSRLALAWRGRFFNARGTWQGRAGQLELPASEDRFELPEGSSFAILTRENGTWPPISDRRPQLQFVSRAFDEERYPLFRYALGDIQIEERIRPQAPSEGAGLERRFELRSPYAIERLHFQGANGRQRVHFTASGDGDFVAHIEELISW